MKKYGNIRNLSRIAQNLGPEKYSQTHLHENSRAIKVLNTSETTFYVSWQELTVFTCFEISFLEKTVFPNEVMYRLTANLCLKHPIKDLFTLIF